MKQKEYYKILGHHYIDRFNNKWEVFTKELYYIQHQFLLGSRLRPCILLGGYLATKSSMEMSESEYDYVIDVAICVEIVHKVSLILDDWLDSDLLRHGYNTFHKEFGIEKSVMFSLNLISIATKKLTQIIDADSASKALKDKGLSLFLDTLYDMSLGELEELDLTQNNRFDYNLIKKIMHLETTPLITSSFLLGYYAGDGNNAEVERIFKSIGSKCGYVFQTLNDLEPFSAGNNNILHKGSKNIDFDRFKKNMIIALLYQLLSANERKILEETPDEELELLLIKYFEKYKLKESIFREVASIKNEIHCEITQLSNLCISQEWCIFIKYFIDYIIELCLSRTSN